MEEEAEAEAAEILRLNPSFSLEVFKQRILYTHGHDSSLLIPTPPQTLPVGVYTSGDSVVSR
jgi:hypothetical protein